MSYRPNYQAGRRGGGGGRRGGQGGGERGGRGGGGGEQRWWDPVWRAERLAQKAAKYEVMDEIEWWNKLEGFKKGGEQEMIIKRCFRRDDREVLSDMAHQLGLYLKPCI